MKACSILLFLASLLVTQWGYGMSLGEVQGRLSEELENISTETLDQHKELKRVYLSALLRRESAARREGDLDTLQAIREEVVRIEHLERLTAPPSTTSETLRKLSSIVSEKINEIDQEAADKVSTLVTSLEAYSETQATEHTRRGNLNEAIAWRDWGRELKEQPDIAEILSVTVLPETAFTSDHASADQDSNLYTLREQKRITTQANEFSDSPALYEAGAEPKGDEKRISAHTPSAQGAGHTLMQATISLINEDDTISNHGGYSYEYTHKSHLYIARITFTPLPGKSLEPSLVVFDLFKRGSGSKRAVIRTDGMLIPAMASGDRWVADSGPYTYETTKYDSRFSHYDRESATADEFYGFIISIFNSQGELLLQRASERALGDYARSEVPDKFKR